MAKKENKLTAKEKALAKKLDKAVIAHKLDTNKKKLLKALTETRGLVLTACNKANIGRSTHYDWYHKDEEYKASVDAINDMMVEGVESKLKDLIDDGNTAAIIFYLKTKGRDSGYGNQIQVDAKVEGEITVNPIKIVNPGKK